MENSIAEIESLRNENDSLKKIITEMNSKYVFDSISFRKIYSKNNKYERNADFEIELLVVGYNPDKSYFIKYDSIVDRQKINPYFLPQSEGGFKYKTKLTEKINNIWIEMNVENDFGQQKKGVLHESIQTKN
ncbi:hypothetical protein V8G61_11185 [Gaetbulibacter sp. M240]|uniref:hypothetical protein n=1 Tax=Gaetbulibacter sp. M240 TaxID=3126511 RepID=UPI00374E6CB8